MFSHKMAGTLRRSCEGVRAQKLIKTHMVEENIAENILAQRFLSLRLCLRPVYKQNLFV